MVQPRFALQEAATDGPAGSPSATHHEGAPDPEGHRGADPREGGEGSGARDYRGWGELAALVTFFFWELWNKF